MDPQVRQHDEYCSHPEPRKIDDTYLFDSASGLYKPKTDAADGDRERDNTESKLPLRVAVTLDWIAIFLSIATLIAVASYT